MLARLAAADRRTSRRVCQAWNSVFLAALEALAPPQWPPSLQGGLLARCGALAALDLSRCFFDPQGAGRMQVGVGVGGGLGKGWATCVLAGGVSWGARALEPGVLGVMMAAWEGCWYVSMCVWQPDSMCIHCGSMLCVDASIHALLKVHTQAHADSPADPPAPPSPQAWLQQLAHLPRLARLTLSKESLVVLRSLQHRARPQSLYVMALPAAIGQLTGLEHLAIVPCDTARPLQGHVQVGDVVCVC